MPLSSRRASPVCRSRPIAAPLASAVLRIRFAKQKRWFRRPASGPHTSLESVAVEPGCPVSSARCSPGVLASSGPYACQSWSFVSERPPPMSFFASTSPHPEGCDFVAAPALRSLNRPGCGLAGSRPRTCPLEVRNLVLPLRCLEVRRSWLMYSPPTPSHVTALCESNSDRSGLLPEIGRAHV